MKKKTIGIIYLLALLFELWGLGVLGQALSPHSLYWGPVSPIYAIIILLIASIISMVAWISALVHLARAQKWGWFTLMFFFSGIMMVIFLFVELQTPVAGSYAPYAGMPQGAAFRPASGQTGSPQLRRQVFRLGLLFGGIIAGANILWDFVYYIPSVGQALGNPSLLLFSDTPIGFSVVAMGITLLLSIAGFVWAGRTAMQRTGQVSIGIDVALRAFGWFLIAVPLMTISDTIYGMTQDVAWRGIDSLYLLFINLSGWALSALLIYSTGLPAAAIGARTTSPGAMAPQEGTFSISLPSGAETYPPQPFVGQPAPHFSPVVPQPVAPSQPTSALDILQQRYARGEIDGATYQQMRSQLEAR